MSIPPSSSRLALVAIAVAVAGCQPLPEPPVADEVTDGPGSSGPTFPADDGGGVGMTGPSSTTATSSTTTDGSSTGEATFGDETSVGDASVGFIISSDAIVCGAAVPPGTLAHCSWCDPFAQDCPDGEKCMPWANDGGDDWNATRCSAIEARPAQVGEACVVQDSAVSGVDDCDLGLVCAFVDPTTLEGTCVAMCGGSQADPICARGDTCLIAFDGVITLCLPACDPLLDDCALGTCVPDEDDGFVCFVAGDAIAPGEACEELHDCGPSASCQPVESTGPCGD